MVFSNQLILSSSRKPGYNFPGIQVWCEKAMVMMLMASRIRYQFAKPLDKLQRSKLYRSHPLSHWLRKWVYSGRGDGSYRRRLDQVIKISLLILDDFGLQSMPEPHQEDLYEVICEKHEKCSLIITSNRDLSEWSSVFTNSLLATAAMDRLVYKGIEIVIDGNSYRLDQFRQRAKTKKELVGNKVK